ncbi:MAG TPA: hypothetical protein VI462_14780 [Acidimicrobiia bacterium]|jgi:hypothetical protein
MDASPEPRPAARAALDVFVGEWSIAALFPDAPPTGPAGRAVFAWDLGGQFLVQRVEIADAAAPDSQWILAADGDGTTYTAHYFDSRGVVRLYRMTFGDGIWTLQRDTADFSPLPFAQRFRGTFSDDATTIHARWELAEDGATWRPDFDLTYTRLA